MNASARSLLMKTMSGTEQMTGMTVLQHGESVRDHYADLMRHITEGGLPRYKWRLPAWTAAAATMPLPDEETMAEYHLFHDCGKPACRTIDDEGRQHFPNHATVSRKVWIEAGGSPEIGDLIGMDMDAHLLKADGLEEFAGRSQAPALLLTALAEIHSNAEMFGGIGSTGFKIKWKHIEKRGRQVMALIE